MAREEEGSRSRIGIDVGGTFTDFVLANMATGQMIRFKEPSVPADPSKSVELGLPALIERAGVAPEDVELIVHGTTLSVNAIIQRRGAKVGLVVCRGHRGILEIGRANLANSYDFRVQKEEPLVKRDLIFETNARTLADGTIIHQPENGELEAIAEGLKEKDIEAVTVLLLHSYAHPEMEQEVAASLRAHLGGIPVTESAYIWPERREFERCLVAIMNAYVQPLMDDYLHLLTERIGNLGVQAPIYITTSNGGTLSIETARQRPVDTILSGPASGVVAASQVAAEMGERRLITVDMGGTSCDMAVTQNGEPEYTTLTHVGDIPLVLPVVNISTIGAGGGSIVWVDPQGVLKVGPQSAGADPGPVCYGIGGMEPTVTDCYLLSGYIHPDHFLGGRMKLDRQAATMALEGIAKKISMTGEDRAIRAAEAALQVTTAVMSTELYKGLAQRGEDPRDFTLMAYGGAGPTHANLLAQEARLTSVVVPPAPSTFCAMGAILADVKRDYVRSQHLKFAEGKMVVDDLAAEFRELEREAEAWVKTEGDLLGQPEFTATCDMRYAGQAFDLKVTIPDKLRLNPDAEDISELFHQEHEKIYSFRDLESGVEITTERIQVTGKILPIELPEIAQATKIKPADDRKVYYQGSFIDSPVYLRHSLGAGAIIAGPAIIEQEDSTIWVVPGWTAKVDGIGNLQILADK